VLYSYTSPRCAITNPYLQPVFGAFQLCIWPVWDFAQVLQLSYNSQSTLSGNVSFPSRAEGFISTA
jgi:hypothetical protein